MTHAPSNFPSSPGVTPIARRADASTSRLAAIMFADIVNFTAMAARDEAAAIALWNDFLASVVDPALDRLSAGVRKRLGDGLLATFDSAATAVTCAEAVQAAIAADRAARPQRWPGLSLRVAVHLADVRFAGDDALGEGVNLAKRLQEAAAPDAVILSQAAREAMSGPGEARLRDVGYVALKGFATPVRAFDLGDGAGLARPADETPSIAVMPFDNLGADEADRYFADGLVEDVIVSLSGLHEMHVIARSSTLAFRDRQIDPREARRLFGVRYVLQGSVRRRGPAIRLSATLSDAETGATLFSTRRDMTEARLFDEQDRLVEEVVAAIAPQVRQAELARALRKPPEVFSAYDRFLKALDLMRRLDRDRYAEAKRLLDAATEVDPAFATAHAWKAGWQSVMVAQGWAADRAAAADEAEADARRAIELDARNALALATLGQTKAFLRGDHEAALALHERARQAGPGHAVVWMLSAGAMAYVGRGAEAVRFAEHARRLGPIDHILFRQFDWLSLAHYAAGDFGATAYWARRALDEEGGHLPSLRLLAAALVGAGDVGGAERAATTLLDVDPAFRVGPYAASHATFAAPALQRRWIDHLLASGLPR